MDNFCRCFRAARKNGRGVLKTRAVFVAALFCLARAAAFPVPAAAAEWRVPVTTGVLASVVGELSGGRVRAEVLVPPGACPGHFDIKTGHLRLMEDGGVLFAHGFEGYLDRFRERVRNPGFRVRLFPLEGSWQLPGQQVLLYRAVAAALQEHAPLPEGVYRRNLARAEALIAESGREAGALVARSGHAGVPVLASEHQAGLLKYLGFRVAGVFGRGEDLTPAAVRDLLERGRAAGAVLVVDNLQSGEDAGVLFARELGARRVVLSNFPGVFPETATLREMMAENARRVLAALD